MEIINLKYKDSILNGDCLKIIPTLSENSIDGVITSPPYNLGKNPNHRRKGEPDANFYSLYEDCKTPEDYIKLIVKTMNVLCIPVKDEGVVLLNLSYCSKDPSLPYRLLVKIEEETKWKLRDTIFWKKPNAIPFQTSPCNLSRIVETVFVLSRKVPFISNKPVKKINDKTGQKFYGYMDNFIEAPCFDKGMRKKHKATFSTDFAKSLIEMYFPIGSVILDPFCGVGTTGNACRISDRHYILIDIDPKYTKICKKRLFMESEEEEEVKTKKAKNNVKKANKEWPNF